MTESFRPTPNTLLSNTHFIAIIILFILFISLIIDSSLSLLHFIVVIICTRTVLKYRKTSPNVRKEPLHSTSTADRIDTVTEKLNRRSQVSKLLQPHNNLFNNNNSNKSNNNNNNNNNNNSNNSDDDDDGCNDSSISKFSWDLNSAPTLESEPSYRVTDSNTDFNLNRSTISLINFMNNYNINNFVIKSKNFQNFPKKLNDFAKREAVSNDRISENFKGCYCNRSNSELDFETFQLSDTRQQHRPHRERRRQSIPIPILTHDQPCTVAPNNPPPERSFKNNRIHSYLANIKLRDAFKSRSQCCNKYRWAGCFDFKLKPRKMFSSLINIANLKRLKRYSILLISVSQELKLFQKLLLTTLLSFLAYRYFTEPYPTGVSIERLMLESKLLFDREGKKQCRDSVNRPVQPCFNGDNNENNDNGFDSMNLEDDDEDENDDDDAHLTVRLNGFKIFESNRIPSNYYSKHAPTEMVHYCENDDDDDDEDYVDDDDEEDDDEDDDDEEDEDDNNDKNAIFFLLTNIIQDVEVKSLRAFKIFAESMKPSGTSQGCVCGCGPGRLQGLSSKYGSVKFQKHANENSFGISQQECSSECGFREVQRGSGSKVKFKNSNNNNNNNNKNNNNHNNKNNNNINKNSNNNNNSRSNDNATTSVAPTRPNDRDLDDVIVMLPSKNYNEHDGGDDDYNDDDDDGREMSERMEEGIQMRDGSQKMKCQRIYTETKV
ncbi:hypothetical protein HELRODRAFT_178238 [Helobdella robusta]|uniref:Uncharacterized protein n=1 Tax=Helobdella robusta TaxID=6412 RepID=T1FCZ5_HELRO|nr:hypothetical protein HELRODRAFT_178238 [Helobdella robusta]ESN97440.1 hypothetical protein HELRODRAFT_178238 [Helobdella robusta]